MIALGTKHRGTLISASTVPDCGIHLQTSSDHSRTGWTEAHIMEGNSTSIDVKVRLQQAPVVSISLQLQYKAWAVIAAQDTTKKVANTGSIDVTRVTRDITIES